MHYLRISDCKSAARIQVFLLLILFAILCFIWFIYGFDDEFFNIVLGLFLFFLAFLIVIVTKRYVSIRKINQFILQGSVSDDGNCVVYWGERNYLVTNNYIFLCLFSRVLVISFSNIRKIEVNLKISMLDLFFTSKCYFLITTNDNEVYTLKISNKHYYLEKCIEKIISVIKASNPNVDIQA